MTMTEEKIKAMSNLNLYLILFCSATLAIGVTLADASSDQHFHWKNERGESVYSDRPPAAGTEYEVVKFGSARPREDSMIPAGGSETERSEEVQSKIAKDEINCGRARMNLIALEGADVIRVRNATGESVQMSPDERAVATETAKAQINVFCKE
ncbi:MAG: hypothetical protein ACJAYC_002220 [Halieaceae bacterium]|jgi:hypothetical protein